MPTGTKILLAGGLSTTTFAVGAGTSEGEWRATKELVIMTMESPRRS